MFGIRLNPISDDDIVRIVTETVSEKEHRIIANHNLHSLYLWRRDARMRRFYELADLIHIDGMFLIFLANLLGIPLRRQHRATSLDFFPRLAPLAAHHGWRLFYLGSKPGIAARAAVRLRARFPGLQIRTQHGHFDTNPSGVYNRAVLDQINAYAPHILLVGMGMPRQENWILDNYKYIHANVIFPTGAFMDYMAGEIPQAPRWLASLYMEWLFRLISEPTRLSRRYLLEPWFVLHDIARYYLTTGEAFARTEAPHE